MKEGSLAIGSTLAALLASLCCLGPLLLGGAGWGRCWWRRSLLSDPTFLQ